MANYLVPAGNALPVSSESRSRDDIMYVNDMHRLKIYNKSGTIAFSGFVPTDFSISLSASWEAPFGGTSIADLVGKVAPGAGAAASTVQSGMKMMGASGLMKAMSAQVWQSPSYFSLDLPVFLDAYTDTKREVIDNTIKLLSLVTPEESVGGYLIPPGPIPLKAVLGDITGSADFDDKEAFTVDIGKFLSVGPCVVKNVVSQFESTLEDGTGNPMACDFILQVSSYFACTRKDLIKWFNPGAIPSTDGASTP